MSILLITAVLAGIETISLTALTTYSKNKDVLYLLLSVFIFAIINPVLLLMALRFEGIGTVNFLWNICTTVSMFMIGHYVFGDTINYLHILSAFLGISAIIVLFIANLKK